MTAEEAAAVERARAGDREAFGVLVERHSRAVFRVAYRMTGNEQDAEDMVQETFLRAYRQMRGFDVRAEFSTWVTRIAVNCSLDLLRARSRRGVSVEIDEGHTPLASEPSAERTVFARQLRQNLKVALARLTPAERAAFVMRHYEGAAVGEIARALDKSNGATRHCIFRAVQKLREALEAHVSTAAAEPYGRTCI